MELKKCSKCEEIKPLEEFDKHSGSRDGRAWACRVCRTAYYQIYRQENKESIAKKNKAYYQENKEYYAKYNKVYREENKELLSEQIKAYCQANKEAIAEKKKAYYLENKEAIAKCKKAYREKNKEAIAKKMKAYREENKEAIAKYQFEYKRDHLRNDPTYRLLHNMRSGIWKCLKGKSKTSPTLDYVGKTSEELMSYLELQFTEGMSRENYGEWHLDHIRPLASFEFDKHKVGSAEFEALLGEAWHYTNLQPLWAADNISKGAKWGPVEKD